MNWYESLKKIIVSRRYPSYDALLGRITTFAREGKITIEQSEELKSLLNQKEDE